MVGHKEDFKNIISISLRGPIVCQEVSKHVLSKIPNHSLWSFEGCKVVLSKTLGGLMGIFEHDVLLKCLSRSWVVLNDIGLVYY